MCKFYENFLPTSSREDRATATEVVNLGSIPGLVEQKRLLKIKIGIHMKFKIRRNSVKILP